MALKTTRGRELQAQITRIERIRTTLTEEILLSVGLQETTRTALQTTQEYLGTRVSSLNEVIILIEAAAGETELTA